MDQSTIDIDQGGSSNQSDAPKISQSLALRCKPSHADDDDVVEIVDVRQGKIPQFNRHHRFTVAHDTDDDEIEVVDVRQGEVPDYHHLRNRPQYTGDDECRIEHVKYSPFIPRVYASHPLAPRTLAEQSRLKSQIAARQNKRSQVAASSERELARRAINKRKSESRPIVSGSVDSAAHGMNSAQTIASLKPPAEIIVDRSKRRRTESRKTISGEKRMRHASAYGDIDETSDEDVTSTPSSPATENGTGSVYRPDYESEPSLWAESGSGYKMPSALVRKSPQSRHVGAAKRQTKVSEVEEGRRVSWHSKVGYTRRLQPEAIDLCDDPDDRVHPDAMSLLKFEEYFENAVRRSCNCSTFQLEDSPAVKQANTRVDPRDSTGQTRAQYGRIMPVATARLLREHLNVDRNDIFIDIGHGIGNTCLQAACTIGCEARGIEVTSDRHSLAERIQRDFLTQTKALGKTTLIHGRMEVKQHRDFLTESGRRPVKVSKKTFQKYTLDDYLAGLFSYMAPGSKLATLHELTFNANPLGDTNDQREMHGLPPDSNASYYEMEKVVLGQQNECVSWSAQGSCTKDFFVYIYTRVGEAKFLCSNPSCAQAHTGPYVSAFREEAVKEGGVDVDRLVVSSECMVDLTMGTADAKR